MNRTFPPSRTLAALLATLLASCAAGDGARDGPTAGEPGSEVTSKSPPRGGERAGGEPADTGYVVGGVVVPPGKYPFAVALARRIDGALSQYCGGALVRPDVVLTAAHCRVKASDVAVIGREDLMKRGGQAIPIIEVVVHEEYDAITMQHDIALLRLARPAPPQYRTVQAETAAEDVTGRAVTAIGWGRTSEDGPPSLRLLETSLAVMSHPECAARYRMRKEIRPEMVCASAPEKDTCQGDSGGPLFTADRDGGTPVQVGITSFGYGCADPSFPGVYTRVGAHASWLTSHLPR